LFDTPCKQRQILGNSTYPPPINNSKPYLQSPFKLSL
jgi:hypothetical protein